MGIMSRTARRLAVAALAGGVLLGGPAFAQDTATEVRRIDEAVSTLRGQLDQLGPQHLVSEQLIREYSFATAFVDARYLFTYGSYADVAGMLQPIVEDPQHRANAGYPQAVYMLAESLYHERNLLMARHYYEQLADDPELGLTAARRRLEIAVAMGRYDALEALYRDLDRRAGASADAEVAYVRGKALYFQERYADAVVAFQAVGPDAEVFNRARYFVGVTHARLGQLDLANEAFDEVLERVGAPTVGESDVNADLRALAQLGKGRLAYEVQDWETALNEYSAVSRLSPRYEAALYEIAWTQIQQGGVAEDRVARDRAYTFALNNLQSLTTIADHDSRFRAQAQLLRGDLLLRMERYDAAVEQFEDASAQYLPVEQELREIQATHDDPDAFFDAVVNPEEGSLRLPIAARPWFDSDPQLDRALLAIHDVEVIRGWIEESELLIEQLDAALNRGGRVNAFPRIREGWARASAIQVEATALLVDVVEAEAAAIVPNLSSGEAGQYESLRRARVAQQGGVTDQPRTFAEVDAREQRVIDDLNRLMLEAHRAQLQIEAEREDLEALREMYIERAGGAPTPELRELRRQFESEERRLDAYEEEAVALRRELTLRQVELGVGDAVGEAERAGRAQFIAALAAEERFLAARRASASNPGALGQVDTIIGSLMAIDRDCETFYVNADRLVAQQTAEMRDLLERERASVESYHALLDRVDAEARATAGQVAFAAFEDIYFNFSELTLRANLGIIDVAWRQKEVLSSTIERLFEERNQSLRELDADFAELLEDE